MSSLFTLLCFELYIFVFFVLSPSKSSTSSLVLKLIHPDLVPNSYYNSNVSLSEHIRRVDYSSMARYNYLTMKNIQPSKYDDIQSTLTPDKSGAAFTVNFSIGEPPVSLTMFIDTGSQLLWVPCYPCKNCSSQYDPAKSSTYSNVSCDSQNCLGFGRCSTTRNCVYEVKYTDKSSSRGELAKKQLIFSTIDDGRTSISGIVFGCGHENQGVGLQNGILGLGADRLSLVSQLGSKFSYCIGSLRDPNYEHSNLVIGEESNIVGCSTPIKTYDGLYYLTLEGISVGDKRLDIDPEIFIKRSMWDNNGVIIDSGTTISYLARSAHNPLTEEVQSLIGGLFQNVTVDKGKLCYTGNASRDIKDFPAVSFHFSGGANLVVDAENIFRQYTQDVFCLTVDAVDDNELNIIGITAQQYYNFGYNLQNMTLSLQSIDCRFLQD